MNNEIFTSKFLEKSVFKETFSELQITSDEPISNKLAVDLSSLVTRFSIYSDIIPNSSSASSSFGDLHVVKTTDYVGCDKFVYDSIDDVMKKMDIYMENVLSSRVNKAVAIGASDDVLNVFRKVGIDIFNNRGVYSRESGSGRCIAYISNDIYDMIGNIDKYELCDIKVVPSDVLVGNSMIFTGYRIGIPVVHIDSMGVYVGVYIPDEHDCLIAKVNFE